MSELLTRNAPFEQDGRNLDGFAVRWDTPAKVQDSGAAYDEAFSRQSYASFDGVTLGLYRGHPFVPSATAPAIPFGRVSFADSEEGLRFSARVDESAEGDAALADIDAAELRGVSLGFYPGEQVTLGRLVTRTAVRPLELSLVRKAAHSGTEISVREGDDNQALLTVKRRLLLLP